MFAFMAGQGFVMSNAGGPRVTIFFDATTGHAVNATTQGIYTFSNRAIGDAAAGRQVYALFMVNAGTPTAVSIGGLEATQVTASTPASIRMYCYKATVPTGTTATVSITLNSNSDFCGLMTIAAYDASTTDHDTAAVDTTLSTTINIARGGALIGYAGSNADGGTQSFTWSANMDEQFDEVMGAQTATHHTGAYREFSGAQTGATVSATPTSTSGAEAMLVVSLAPAA